MKYCSTFVALLFFTTAWSQFVVENVADGKAYYEQGEYHLALEKFRDALNEEPQNGMIHYDLALCYKAMNEFENALLSIDQAIQLIGPELREMTMLEKGAIMDGVGFREASLQFYENAIQHLPRSFRLINRYGAALLLLDRKTEAQEVFVRSLHLKFDEADGHRHLATLMAEQKREVPARLGLYYFLMLEDPSNRSANIRQQLFDLMKSVAPRFSQNQTTTPTELELFISKTNTFFGTIAPLVNKGKTGKEHAANPDEIITLAYMTFFGNLFSAGHTEGLCLDILLDSTDPTGLNLSDVNRGKLLNFQLWYEANKIQQL
jgi:tetratricopeptide (TPR) repeat protein